MRFSGVFHPLITPFTSSGDVDTGAIARNARRYLPSPLTGLVVLGSNGESPQLDEHESDRVIAAVRDVVPLDRPLLAGAARESTRATIGPASGPRPWASAPSWSARRRSTRT
jgi:4-hydroxy-2-oxoglutarate aldolase